MLTPELPHNRAAFERIARWQRRSLPAFVVLTAMGVWLLPVRTKLWFAEAVFAVAFATFGGCEIQKTRIFAKDLRERGGQV